MTQTNPIAYKDKMEELKDGEKGAPSPSYKFYPKDRFLTDPPMEKEGETQPEDNLPEWGEPIPENLEGWEDESFVSEESSKVEEEPKIERELVAEESQAEEWWQEEGTTQEQGSVQS